MVTFSVAGKTNPVRERQQRCQTFQEKDVDNALRKLAEIKEEDQ